MNTFWMAWSVVCLGLTANGARNRYQYYRWRDTWFAIFVVFSVWNALQIFYFLH